MVRRPSPDDSGKMDLGRRGEFRITALAGETMQTGNDDLALLRALCQTDDAGIRRRACDILRKHAWVAGEHQVIFEACAMLARFNARITPHSLAAQLTRAGFPDVDLDSLFDPIPSAAALLARRLDALDRGPR